MKNYQSLPVKIAATVACFLMLQTLRAQWPEWRGSKRDGNCTETNLLKSWPADGPRMIWASDTLGEGFSSATIMNNMVFTTGKRDSIEILTALDLNGKLLWQTELGKALKAEWPESRCTPTFYKNKLYALVNTGTLACVDSKTGKIEWKSEILKTSGGISSFNGFGESPLVVDDKVILSPCGKNTTFVALNSTTGQTIWTSESVADTNSYVSPVLIEGKGKKLIVSSIQNYVLAAELNTGKILWKQKVLVNTVPLPIGNQIYFPSLTGGKVLTIGNDLNSFNFEQKDTMRATYLGGIVQMGSKIFGTFENPGKGIYGIDRETGKLVAYNKELTSASLLAADGMIYSYEDRTGRVCLLKPTENSIDIISSFKVKQGKGPALAHMSIANGLLFIRHGKYLMAYDIKQI